MTRTAAAITDSGASVEVADFPIELQLVRSGDGWRISSFGGLSSRVVTRDG